MAMRCVISPNACGSAYMLTCIDVMRTSGTAARAPRASRGCGAGRAETLQAGARTSCPESGVAVISRRGNHKLTRRGAPGLVRADPDGGGQVGAQRRPLAQHRLLEAPRGRGARRVRRAQVRMALRLALCAAGARLASVQLNRCNRRAQARMALQRALCEQARGRHACAVTIAQPRPNTGVPC
jgi:hypothetical protein